MLTWALDDVELGDVSAGEELSEAVELGLNGVYAFGDADGVAEDGVRGVYFVR